MRFSCVVCQAEISFSPDDLNILCPQCGQQYETTLGAEGKMQIKKLVTPTIEPEPEFAPEEPLPAYNSENNLPPPGKRKKQKSRLGVIILALILFFLLGGAALFFFFGDLFTSAPQSITNLIGGATATSTITATLPPTATALPTFTALPPVAVEPTSPPVIPPTQPPPLDPLDVVAFMGAPLPTVEQILNQPALGTVPALVDSIPLFEGKPGVQYQTNNWDLTLVDENGKVVGLILEARQPFISDDYARVFVALNLLVDQPPVNNGETLLWSNIHGYDIDLLNNNGLIQTIKIRRNQPGSAANSPLPEAAPAGGEEQAPLIQTLTPVMPVQLSTATSTGGG